MRAISVCLILSVIIALLIAVPHIFITNTVQEVRDILHSADAALQIEDWHSAEQYCTTAVKKWDKYAFWYEMIVEHSAIDEIIKDLRQLDRFIKEQERPEARAIISELDFLVKHIEETDSLSMENIF